MAFTKVTGPGIHTLSNIISHNIDSSGIITATKFVGTFEGSTTGDLVTNDWIIHKGDTNTRIGFPDTDTFAVETSGASRIYVESGGDVGIGTDNPSRRLHVTDYGDHGVIRIEGSGNTKRSGIEFYRESSAGVGKGGAAIWVESDTSNSNGKLRFGTANNAGIQSQNTDMILDNNGQLGIGTDNPTDTLHVGKLNSNHGIKLERYGATNPGSSTIQVHSHGALSVTSSNNITHTSGGSQQHVWMQGSNEAMRIDENRRLGIGTDDPTDILDVYSTTDPTIRSRSGSSSVGALMEICGGSSNDSTLFLSSGTTKKYQIFRDGSQSDDLRIYDTVNALDIMRYRHGGYLHFGVNGEERLRIMSDGKVGIATNNPSSILHVYHATTNGVALFQSGDAYCNIILQDSNSTTSSKPQFGVQGNDFRFVSHDGSSATEKLRINSSGKLLIGTTRTYYANDYYDDITINNSGGSGATGGTGITMISNSNSWGAVQFGDQNDDDCGYIKYDHNADKFIFGVEDGSIRFWLNKNKTWFGTTGHGDGSRSSLFDLVGAYQDPTGVWTQMGLYSSDSYAQNKGGSIGFGGQDGSTARQQFAAIKGAKENGTSGNYAGYMAFYTRPAGSVSGERLRITSTGRTYINTTSPIDGNSTVAIRGAFGASGCGVEIKHQGNQGSNRDFIRFYNVNSAEAGSIEHTSTTAVAFQTSSDHRLKENVVDITDGIERLKLLKPRKFSWIDDPELGLRDGFIAHEVSPVIPHCVSGEKDAVKEDGSIQTQTMEYSQLTPLLTAALQEAIAEIENLKAEVASLKSS